jgi:hypothetical protein
LKFFPTRPGVDSQAFATAIIGIFLRYPLDIVEHCCDPFTGLPSKQNTTPTPYDVRCFCEEQMRPRRYIDEYNARSKVQLRERMEREREMRASAQPRPADPAPGPDGKHPPGTILSNYAEAVKIYGRPIGVFEEGRTRPYDTGRVREDLNAAARGEGKQTIHEIEDEMASRGIYMSGWKARNGGKPHNETPESVRAKFGLTQEQWDALPNAPPRPGVGS